MNNKIKKPKGMIIKVNALKALALVSLIVASVIVALSFLGGKNVSMAFVMFTTAACLLTANTMNQKCFVITKVFD